MGQNAALVQIVLLFLLSSVMQLRAFVLAIAVALPWHTRCRLCVMMNERRSRLAMLLSGPVLLCAAACADAKTVPPAETPQISAAETRKSA